MVNTVRYSMVPEHYWQAARTALKQIRKIEQGWQTGVISSNEAMVSIMAVMKVARENLPEDANDDKKKNG